MRRLPRLQLPRSCKLLQGLCWSVLRLGCSTDMLNCRAVADQLVVVPFQSDRSTRWTRRILKSKESIEEGETRWKKKKKKKNGVRQRRGLCGAATMQKVQLAPPVLPSSDMAGVSGGVSNFQ